MSNSASVAFCGKCFTKHLQRGEKPGCMLIEKHQPLYLTVYKLLAEMTNKT